MGPTWHNSFMRIGAFEITEPVPELRDPHALVVLRPWINVGRVGTLVLSKLERHFGAQDLGQLARPGTFFDFTRYRPRSRVVNGQRTLSIPNSSLKYAVRDDAPDFLFIHLREPHAFGEDYSESILDVLKAFGVKRYGLIGGMYDVVPHTRPLLVSGSASDPEVEGIVKGLGVQSSNYEGPTTITYMIAQEALKLGTQNMTLIVRLPQYAQLDEDHAGVARLLEILGTLYNLPPDVANVERGRRQYQELTAAMDQNPEVRNVLRQLEAHYDAEEASRQVESQPSLSPEVEKFLRELDLKTGGDSG